jgi:tRNA A37 N6-isopentenylltransferase MiaA
MNTGIMIIGPNGVGKTDFAYDLARQNNGEVINLDRAYLYQGFPITTGLQDTLRQQGVRRHLYEMLEANEPSFAADDFVDMVINSSSEILKRGCVPVAEGASTLYVPALLEADSKSKIFKHIIGLRFPKGIDIKSKYRARIEEAFKSGLVEELSSNLHCYENSFLLKECHFSVPTVKYLKGLITLNEAKDEILERCLEYKDRQLQLFAKYTQIQWLDAENAREKISSLDI